MNKQDAIALMKTSLSVEDWNRNREDVKSMVDDKDHVEVMAAIDASGLIVQTLGADTLNAEGVAIRG